MLHLVQIFLLLLLLKCLIVQILTVTASKLDLYVFCHTTRWCVCHICPFFVQTVAIMRDIKRSMLTVAVTYWRGYLSSQSRPSVGEGPPSTETIGVVRGTKLYCSMTEAQVAACELVWRRYVKTGQPGVEPVILNALTNSVDAVSIPSTLFTFVKPPNRIDIIILSPAVGMNY